MGNCYKLYINDRLYLITKTKIAAEFMLRLLEEASGVHSSKIELAYIENIGF
jgi:hypothetical protein